MDMNMDNIIIFNTILCVITQLKVLKIKDINKFNKFLERTYTKKATDTTKEEIIKKINELIDLSDKDNGGCCKMIKDVIDNKNNNKELFSILTNMENVFLNTIEDAKEEEKKQKAKSEGFAKVQTQARVKAQTAGKNISTPKPVPKNKKATNK
jgi:hypothetical protein